MGSVHISIGQRSKQVTRNWQATMSLTFAYVLASRGTVDSMYMYVDMKNTLAKIEQA